MITIPDHAIPVSFVKAIERYKQREKILVILSDENGIYAAQAYSKDWDNLDEQCCEFKQYKEQGKWFLLSQ
ncbi:hypothetical protein O0555_21730 [Brevibacillus laterosporus]|uniref:hypothetical protein n=1 Tax=Brevibacillus laterosporus TaxID=1465 RepID=UPI0018CF223A|nr:hypothetical protein [Brevibacillus laterosporus]MBG9796915.1 hypothetical protein [Brevibacillus laterosporus]MCR8939926.1 hypothetical protein [Brevibacillus laterosporus]MCZ0842566.1 hypothetical protein [Brevibacillus laterosporus]MCZ0847123.1 hypothetical protein [Brevibacillus laterosporus]MED1911309.1 hypothetical protein [Brevibacillus laterosporus]